jgi:hypothetical protein
MKSQAESDFIYKELHCLVVPNEMGHRMGYVGVPYNLGDAYELGLEVHGGITYEGNLQSSTNFYYYGFDCAHSGDAKDVSIMTDEYKKLLGLFRDLNDGTVKTKEYVELECRKLADQLAPLVRADTYKKRLIEEVLK